MKFTITPGEGPHPADAFWYVIKTRVPRGYITEDMVAKRAAAVNLASGDHILLQCTDHDYADIEHESEWVVTSRRETIDVQEINDRESRQVINRNIAVRCLGWRNYIDEDKPRIRWNPGAKTHQIIHNGEMVFESKNKAEVEEYLEAV